jgi:hypothetical protein
MAPFLTHLVIGERVWSMLDGPWGFEGGYGIFLFGCLAPDVDKICAGVDQAVTHFLPKDEGHTYLRQRSQYFLEHQADFLRAPFHELEDVEQALVSGYLCHVATDEITGRNALALRDELAGREASFPHTEAVLTAMDPSFWAMATDPDGIVAALAVAAIPGSALALVPPACLIALRQIVWPQVREGGGLIPYIDMVRRQWQWVRHGRVTDETDDPTLEADLAAYRHEIEADLPASQRVLETLETMQFEQFVDEATTHSLDRIHALLKSGGETNR